MPYKVDSELLEMTRAQTVIVVMGFHRSGTSLAAKILHTLGVVMGDDEGKGMLIGEAVENPGGYYEDEDIIDLNARLMTRAGGGWENPPSTERLINQFHGKESTGVMVDEIIKRKAARGIDVWGFKDPRTVITWPVLREFLPNRKLVVVRRDTEASIASLLFRERNNMAVNKALALYANYAIRINRHMQGESVFPLQYENLVEGPRDQIAQDIARLGRFCFGCNVGLGKIEKAVALIDPKLNRSQHERIGEI